MRAASAVVLAVIVGGSVLAQGELQPQGPPGPSMYSLREIYEQVETVRSDAVAITNILSGLEGVSDIDGIMWDMLDNTIVLTNVVAQVDWTSLSYLPEQIVFLRDALGDVDWHDVHEVRTIVERIDSSVHSVSNDLAELRWIMRTVVTNTDTMVDSLVRIEHRTEAISNMLHNMGFDLANMAAVIEENNAMLHTLTDPPAGK